MAPPFVLDISRLLGRASDDRLPTGVDRVCLAYVQRWGKQSRAAIMKGGWRRLLDVRSSQALFDLLLNPPANSRRAVNAIIARACIPPWPDQNANGALAFYLGHMGLEKPGLVPWLIRTAQKPITAVYDLIPITHPEYCLPGEDARHAQRMRTAVEHSTGIVCISHTTLRTLSNWADQAGLPLPPTVVAHLAPASLPDASGTRPPLGVPYFVVLGTIEPRKNHLLLLQLWRELAHRLGDAAPHLVVIGQRGWECENVVDLLERSPAVRRLVHEVSRCSDTELARYLKHARALLFPSFAEGYGMPLVEALAQGTPVIASDLPVFREVAVDVPHYLDALDGTGWRQAITQYTTGDCAQRARQIERLHKFHKPTWDDHFAQVETFIDRLQSRRPTVA